jgi:NADH:ubiquinone oxidoreductase subunit E
MFATQRRKAHDPVERLYRQLCHIKGAYNVIQTFQQLIEEHRLHEKIDFKSGFCMKQCSKEGVAVLVNGEEHQVPPEQAGEFFVARVMGRIERT